MSLRQCVRFVWSLAISAISKAAPDGNLLDDVSPYQATTRLQKVRIQLPQNVTVTTTTTTM